MEKSTRNGIGIFLLIVIVGFFITNSQTGNSITTDNSGLTGNLIAMDPNRAMKGSPCHSMGGRVMGDCITREINLEAK